MQTKQQDHYHQQHQPQPQQKRRILQRSKRSLSWSSSSSSSYLLVLKVFTFMTLFSFLKRTSSSNNINNYSGSSKAKAAATTTTAVTAAVISTSNRKMNHLSSHELIESRLRGALWGFFAGDALAAPTHWYYGGRRQVIQEYGSEITDYTKPNTQLYGSILNKSDLNGGGRRKSSMFFGSGGDSTATKTIIGDVINHGKQDLWSPNKHIHYHATLQRGENTLEASLARVLMKSIVSQNGKFNPDNFRDEYIKFMMTPGSHNDTYASTCHRMFFSNLIHSKLPPKECPDNDQHNVDTIDGLILPTIAAMTELEDPIAAGTVAAQCAGVTRRSNILENVSKLWANVVVSNIASSSSSSSASSEMQNHNSKLQDTNESLTIFAQQTLRQNPNPNAPDALTACYLQQSLPSLINMIAKYGSDGGGGDNKYGASSPFSVWDALLVNANVGGENVHRGSVLGAILGAQAGIDNIQQQSPQLITGLYHSKELAQEIDDFVHAVLPKSTSPKQQQ